MNYNLLYQCVFCLAFLNFFIYWIDLFFFSFSSNVANSLKHKKKFIKWLPISSSKKSLSQKPASIEITKFIISLTLWCSLTLLIIFRYIQSNHFPLSNFYEALIFLTWSLVTLNFIILFEPFNSKISHFSFHTFSSKLSFPTYRATHTNKIEGKDSEEKKPEKMSLTTLPLKGSRINLFQILPLQIKNNLAPKIFEKLILILREKQEKIIRISSRFSFYQKAGNIYPPVILTGTGSSGERHANNNLWKKESIDSSLHMKEEPKVPFSFDSSFHNRKEFQIKNYQNVTVDKKIDFIQNQFQLYNFRKSNFPNYEYSRFRNIQLQPIALLNVKEWQPTNGKFFNHTTEFSKNLQFFTLLKEIIKIPSEYYKKFGISFLHDMLVLKNIQKRKFFDTLSERNNKNYSLFFPKFENISQEKEKPVRQLPRLITYSLKETKRNQFIDEQKKKEQKKKEQEKKIYGGILAPCILFILAFAQFNLSSEFTPLVPALKSNWLFMHVSIMICSYTTFIVGGLISLILLIQIFFFSRREKNSPSSYFFRDAKASFFRLISFNSFSFFYPKKIVNKTEEQSKKQKELSVNKFGFNNISTILPHGLIVPKLSSFDYYNFLFPNILKREILKKETKLKIKKNSVREFFEEAPFKATSYANEQSRFTNFQTTLISQWKNKRENIKCSSIKTKAWQQLQNKTKQLVFSLSKEKKGGDFNITLDNLSYRMFGIGFPLFTLGLLSGAVWANSAWGSYWSWDIKEVGSFIHWLVLTFYFHCRYKNYITFSHLVGFLSLIVLFFNFFGVSLGIYGSSLHAYS